MSFADAHQKLVDRVRDLILRPRDRNNVTGLLSTRELDLAVPFFLKLFDLALVVGNQFSLIHSVNADFLRDKLGMRLINQIHDLVLDQFQVDGVTSGRTADNVVDFEIFVIAPVHGATVHRIRELDEDRVLLHDALNVLASDADDTLMVLVWNVEGNSSWHLSLNKLQSVFSCVVRRATNIDVEVVVIETIEDDLNIGMRHNLVDLAVLLAADEFLMLVG